MYVCMILVSKLGVWAHKGLPPRGFLEVCTVHVIMYDTYVSLLVHTTLIRRLKEYQSFQVLSVSALLQCAPSF